jgi:uncharacterized protein (DUF58 family)
MAENLSNNQSLQQFSNLDLLAKQVVEGFITGLHKSPFHGFSVEFAEHRLYNAGESVKNIDWKLFARTDKLFVKRFEEETNLRCQLIIDASSSMYYPEGEKNKIQFSVFAAASLIYLLKKQRDAFGLSVFADDLQFSSLAKSTTVHQKLLFTELERLLVNKRKMMTTSVSKSLHQIAEQIHKRSLVIIFSDMMDSAENFDDIFSALQHLKHNKHEVILFHTVDQSKEIDFEFENRPYIFVDVESGEEVKVQSNQIKESYLQSIKKFKKELILKCHQYKIDVIEADIHKGFDQILASYLVKRNKML